MPEWQTRAAHASHVALYALLLAIPLSGWIYSSATGVQVVYLGLVPLPDLVAKDRALAACPARGPRNVELHPVRAGLSPCRRGAEASFHDRDTVLTRMLPARRKKG